VPRLSGPFSRGNWSLGRATPLKRGTPTFFVASRGHRCVMLTHEQCRTLQRAERGSAAPFGTDRAEIENGNANLHGASPGPRGAPSFLRSCKAAVIVSTATGEPRQSLRLSASASLRACSGRGHEPSFRAERRARRSVSNGWVPFLFCDFAGLLSVELPLS
jgi:hypothetical protein